VSLNWTKVDEAMLTSSSDSSYDELDDLEHEDEMVSTLIRSSNAMTINHNDT
jgi:hypothetical protein